MQAGDEIQIPTYIRTTHKALIGDLDELLINAQPRLHRLASKLSTTPDAADDIVQETLIEAWRHLEQLRTPERFDAWLNGICRNVSLRWNRAEGIAAHRQESLSSLYIPGTDEGNSEADIIDPQSFNPAEHLSQEDLTVLLDRALAYLSPTLRAGMELCYLKELPAEEAALRLGLTPNTLRVRLHRARQQLRQVLNGEMREDAEAFGLLLDEREGEGWRETRIWCMFCGRQRMRGILEHRPDGRSNLRLYCSRCQQEWIRSGAIYRMEGIKSFRTAFKRLQRMAAPYWADVRTRQQCSWCQGPVPVRITEPGEWTPDFGLWDGLRFAFHCPHCGSNCSCYIALCLWQHPAVQNFMAQHPRWFIEPENLIEHNGELAYLVCFADAMSSARLTIIAHYRTVQALSVIQT